MSLSFAEKVRGAKRPQEKIPVCLNGEVRQQYEQVEKRIVKRLGEAQQAYDARVADDADARLSSSPTAPFDPPPDPEQPLLEELLEQMREWTEVITFEALPSREYEALIEAHPPRKGPDGHTDRRDGEVNTETFYPALMRASMIDPVMDDDLFAEFLNALGQGQYMRLLNAASLINKKSDDIPLLLGGSGSHPNSSAA